MESTKPQLASALYYGAKSRPMNMLPNHLSDLPPPLAARLEKSRRCALDWLFSHDYALFIPPLAEHLETLTAGDEALELNTFKITDTTSGRTLGIRADHTPQVQRFNAAMTNTDTPQISRYCYFGPVLMTKPPQPWQWREEMQLGAELFGSLEPFGDWEMARLAAGTLVAAGLDDFCVDLGHAGIVHRLLQDAKVPAQSQAEVLRHFSRRDTKAMEIAANGAGDLKPLIRLAQINGDASAIEKAEQQLPQFATELESLRVIAAQLKQDGCDVGVDFSEIGGYGYHTGAVFVFYGNNFIAARGGRYNRNGRETADASASAVGFSMNMREIATHLPAEPAEPAVATVIAADDKEWHAALEKLRLAGRPVRFLPPDEKPNPPCLERTAQNNWKVREK